MHNSNIYLIKPGPLYCLIKYFKLLGYSLILLQSLKSHDLSEAVKYVSRSPDVVKCVRECLKSQPSNVNLPLIQRLLIEGYLSVNHIKALR